MTRESNGGEGSFDASFLKEDAALELKKYFALCSRNYRSQLR
jgi:hypothetical protein